MVDQGNADQNSQNVFEKKFQTFFSLKSKVWEKISNPWTMFEKKSQTKILAKVARTKNILNQQQLLFTPLPKRETKSWSPRGCHSSFIYPSLWNFLFGGTFVHHFLLLGHLVLRLVLWLHFFKHCNIVYWLRSISKQTKTKVDLFFCERKKILFTLQGL